MLFVLFVCLGVAVLVQTLSVIAMCADGAIIAEDSGRSRMQEKDEALAAMREQVAHAWGPTPWGVVRAGPEEVEGSLVDAPESQGWVLEATVRQRPEVSGITVAALVERGRDGMDLPLAGLVADTVAAATGRTAPWLGIEEAEAALAAALVTSTAYLRTMPAVPLLDVGVTIADMGGAWRLDEGWRTFLRQGAAGLAACGPQVCLVVEEGAGRVSLPEEWGVSADSPGLMVVTGGGSLDARGRGDIYGVIVVDGGDVLLADTRLHGAVFVTGTADLGATGALVFSPAVLRWATDRSLQRSRLVPGTRWERCE
jgi:hypothetical protein